jgi:hypothetical protein
MPAHPVLTPTQLALVDAEGEALHGVGFPLEAHAVWPARAFGARVGSPADGATLSLEAQCRPPLRIRHFVTWLIVTQRVATGAEYSGVGRPFPGDVALRHHPASGQAFLDTASSLGLARATAMARWSDVATLAGLHQVRPDHLSRTQSAAGCTVWLAAARRYRPSSESQLALAETVGGAEATLFHLGVSAAPPTKLGNASIGSAAWLRVPVGKLHSDRYIPLHPQLEALLDDWLARRRGALRPNARFTDHGRRITAWRVDSAVEKGARAAGPGRIAPPRLRHTLATQAIHRGMSLAAIAALVGHRSLTMRLVYARLADRTVANDYFAVSAKVGALYDQPQALPADAEGIQMRQLRSAMHRRMLGNGCCARPVEMDCHFESICESCAFFVTTAEFRPTLRLQRDDAAAKGQVGRQRIFEGLLARLDDHAP